MTRSPAARPRRAASARAAATVFPLLLLPVLAAVLAVSVYGPEPEHGRELVLGLAVASAAWLAAVAIARTGAGDLRLVVAGAIALRLLAFAGQPVLSDDVHRYAWEGELVVEGISPYAHAPDAPELAVFRGRRDGLFARVGHPHVSAAYPPGAQAAFAAAALAVRAAGEEEPDARWPATIELLRALFGLCDLLVLVPLVLLLRGRGLPTGMAVAWGWCPLVAVEFAGSGHLDALGILLLVGALALHERSPARRRLVPSARELCALALLAGATLVKLLPACAAPFVARGRGAWLRLFVFAALVLAGFAPVLLLAGGQEGLSRGLSEYGFRWESASLAYGALERVLVELGLPLDESLLDARRVGRAIVLVLWLALLAGMLAARVRAVEATAVLIAAFLVLSPTLHPWYVAWIVPFLALRPGRAFLWLAASAVLLHLAPVGYARGGPFEVPLWARALIAAPFFLLLALELRGARRA